MAIGGRGHDGLGARPTDDPSADVLTLTREQLEQECAALASAIAADGGDVTALAPYAPGGAQNPDEGARAWYRYFRQLDRAHGRLTAGASGSGAAADRLAQAVAGALSEEPIAVTFHDGRVRYVHPKSYHALAWLESLDRQHKTDAQAAAAAAELLTREDLQVFALAPVYTSLAVRLWLWILTSKGAGLPFDEEATQVQPPAWTKDVSPDDLVKVFEAHVAINYERLAVMTKAYPSEHQGQPSRLPLAGFIGAIANETGQDARLLMRRHSLGKIFAQAIAGAEAAREARQRAEDRASTAS